MLLKSCSVSRNVVPLSYFIFYVIPNHSVASACVVLLSCCCRAASCCVWGVSCCCRAAVVLRRAAFRLAVIYAFCLFVVPRIKKTFRNIMIAMF